ncbi:MAG: hypothetical protein BalsKO_24870 [Balneolaceae bacterium]
MNFFKTTLFGMLVFTFSVLTFLEAVAQSKGEKGIGLMIGDPTGITFKNWTSSNTAFDLGAAWSLEGSGGISIHGDHLWHSWFDVDKGNFAFYYGVGARARFIENEDSSIGIRIPLGVNYLLENTPLDLFVEIAPIVDLIPDTDASGDGAIGIRYYF